MQAVIFRKNFAEYDRLLDCNIISYVTLRYVFLTADGS